MFELINAFLPWIQYPAAALTIIGYYFVGSKTEEFRKIGFVMGLIGNVMWIVYGVLPIQPGIIATNLCIFTLGARGYLNNK